MPPHPADRPQQTSNALHRLPLAVSHWPSAAWDKATLTGARGARPPTPVTPGDSWPSPAGPAGPPSWCTGLSQHRQPCLRSPPPPGLHSSRGGGPSATGSTERTVGRPQWGKTYKRSLQPSAQDQTPVIAACSGRASPCAVVRRKPAPQRGQKNVCGARPQFQTTRTFLRPHPPKEPFPQKHLPCSKGPPSAPHAPCVQEGERRHGQGGAESVLALGPWARCPKEEDFRSSLLAPTALSRCPLLTSPKKNDFNLPSNKNMCVSVPEPLTALELALIWAGLMALPHWEARCIFY